MKPLQVEVQVELTHANRIATMEHLCSAVVRGNTSADIDQFIDELKEVYRRIKPAGGPGALFAGGSDYRMGNGDHAMPQRQHQCLRRHRRPALERHGEFVIEAA